MHKTTCTNGLSKDHFAELSISLCQKAFEPRHHKTNKLSVRPAKTQISLGIRPVWSESSLSAWWNLGSLATHWVHSEDSDQTGRMLGAHSFCWICHVIAHLLVWVMTQPVICESILPIHAVWSALLFVQPRYYINCIRNSKTVGNFNSWAVSFRSILSHSYEGRFSRSSFDIVDF